VGPITGLDKLEKKENFLVPPGIQTLSVKKSLQFFLLRHNVIYLFVYLGHAIEQLVEALRYKSEGRGFDSRWCHWNFSLT
jgi:hypothetical protein